MKNTKIGSIKARLLTYLVSFIVLVWMAVAFLSLVSMQKGGSQIVDMQLEQLAKALAEMPSFTDTDVHDEEEKIFHEKFTQASPIYFQIWRDGNIDISTYKLELTDIQNIPEGFSKRQIKNELWRLYLYKNSSDSERTILTFTESDKKNSFIDPLIEIVGFHLIAEIIAIIFIILFVVKKSLIPLNAVVNHVAHKNYNNLDPIPLNEVPDEMLPLGEALNSLLSRLRKSIAMEREFTAHAAHELKTPLAALKMQAQVALNEKDQNIQKQQLKKTIGGVNRANHVISQMLLLARYEEDTFFPKENLVLSALVSQVLDELSPFINEKNIIINKGFDLNAVVSGNRDAIQIMVKNIIDNAIRYSPQNSQINLNMNADKGRISLSVEDQGIGISSSIRDKIFERFYRGKNKQNPEGSGLGLSIVKRIAEINGIDINLKSNQTNDGTCFQFIFYN